MVGARSRPRGWRASAAGSVHNFPSLARRLLSGQCHPDRSEGAGLACARKEALLGAIRKRGKHYFITYYDATGRRRWETIGPNLHEAKQVLAQRMWERRNGKFRLTRKGITMAEFIAKWEDDHLVVRQQLGRLKESTLVGYRVNLRLHIGPFFGRMRIDEIALPHVREFVKALLAKNLAPASVLKSVAL